MRAAEHLRRVRWLGGGSGAGKSTIARRVAAELGLQLYDTDLVMAEHAARMDPDRAPLLHDFLAMTMDQRWVERTPTVMLDSFHWFAGEGFDLVVDDVEAHAARGGVLAEGFRLLPRHVAPLLLDARAAVWLLPTPDFRRSAFERRGLPPALLDETSDGGRALENLLERDRLFTERLRAELAELQLPTIEVDVGVTDDDLFGRVVDALLPPDDG